MAATYCSYCLSSKAARALAGTNSPIRRLITSASTCAEQPTTSTASLAARSTPSTSPSSISKAQGKRRASSSSQATADNSRWPGWTPVIGLELHVQLKGNVKLLSGAKAIYDAFPNTHVAHLDAALPGALPVLQREPVHLALLACLALKSNINPRSTFDRKHYFYPDLPSGFQVTQKYSPLAKGGLVKIRQDVKGQSHEFTVRIDQIQLEQDTAKSTHDPETGTTFVDLNRAGAALIEIVTEPDMRTPEEAAAFVRHLQAILRHVGASDANMERGELRCDVNVSVHRDTAAAGEFGNRCEVKNLNGVRFLVGAIESEITRQIVAYESGESIEQATRGFDAVTGETFHLRSKEDAPDYRYMPDPELGPVVVTPEELEALERGLPELPDEMFVRMQEQYGLPPRDANVLVALEDGKGVAYFEKVAQGRDGRVVGNWVINELLGQLSKAQIGFLDNPVEAEELGKLIDAVGSGILTGTVAKSLLTTFLTSPTTAPLSTLIKAQQSSTPTSDDIEVLCEKVIEDLPEEAGKVRKGQGKVLMRLVGEVMKRSQGKADAKVVMGVLKGLLGAR